MKQNSDRLMTARFVKAMHQVMANERARTGKLMTKRAFAESIGGDLSNVSKFTAKKNYRTVNLELLERAAVLHKISPNWVVLGKGPMLLDGKEENRLDALENRIKALEKRRPA